MTIVFQAPAVVLTSWQQFMQQLMPYLVAVAIAALTGLALVIKAAATNIVNKFQVSHAETIVAVKDAAAASATATDEIKSNTNGINQGLREQVAIQQTTAEHLAVVTELKTQLADVTKRLESK